MWLLLSASCAAILASSHAGASEIVIPLPQGVETQTVRASYDCGGRGVEVTYINAGDISLAVLSIDGETVAASGVVAASGARYAGGRFLWWTKGDAADLYDITVGGEDVPVANCTAQP